jgi:hypothetical protein
MSKKEQTLEEAESDVARAELALQKARLKHQLAERRYSKARELRDLIKARGCQR